jgi:glycosyltransferase involved in cell wall biosynthesis
MSEELQELIRVVDKKVDLLEIEIAKTKDELDLEKRKTAFLMNELEGVGQFFTKFSEYRKTKDYEEPFVKPEPLVSVLIPTYNRQELLFDRCLPSVMGQSYQNIEIVIVGDKCTDDTFKVLEEMKHPKIKYLNLPVRGPYPKEGRERWSIAGFHSASKCIELAEGHFLTNIDDDDEMLPGRIEKLIKTAQEKRADLVFHPFLAEVEKDCWVTLGEAGEYIAGQVTTGSVLFHRYFKDLQTSFDCYRFLEPGDWNRLRKFTHVGAKVVFHDEILMKHYREGGANRHEFQPDELFI